MPDELKRAKQKNLFFTTKALTAYNKSELFRGVGSSPVCASVKKAVMEVPMGLLHTNEIPPNPFVHGEAVMGEASARKSKPKKPKLLRREHSSCVFLVNGSEMSVPDSQVPADWLE